MAKPLNPRRGSRVRLYPTAIDPIIAVRIIELVAAGSLVKEACAKCKVSEHWFWRQRIRDAQLDQAYTRARANRTDVWAEEMVAIADSATDPRKAAVQISARQWVMAKVDHAKWGDRRDINTNFRAEIDAMTPEQRDARAAELLRKLRFIAGQDEKPTIDAKPTEQPAGIGGNPADSPDNDQ